MTDAQPRLDIDTEGDVVTVSGEIDAHTAPDLAEHLGNFDGSADRIVDLSGVDFMDSSGLRVLIDAHQRAEAAGSKLVLRSPGRAVSRIIEVSGLDQHLHVEHA